MVRNSINARLSQDLFLLRKKHKDTLSQALNNMRISDIDIDKFYKAKLEKINILDEFLKNFRSKKGNLDSFVILIYMFMFTIGIIVAFIIISKGLSITTFINDPTANSLLTNTNTMILKIGNVGFMFGLIALIIFNFVGAFLLVTHPIFVMIDIILMPITIYVAAIMSNIYETSLAATFATEVASFPVMNFLMLNLPLVIVIADILIAIGAYALIKDV